MCEYRELDFAPGYRVGSDGTVWTLKINQNRQRSDWRPLNPWIQKGYASVKLGLGARKKYKTFRVHVLVLTVFVGPRPKGADGCHNNGCRSDNRLENLRWDARAENLNDRIAHGTLLTGEKNKRAKLTDADVRSIRNSDEKLAALALRLNVSISAVSNVRNRKTWSHVL